MDPGSWNITDSRIEDWIDPGSIIICQDHINMQFDFGLSLEIRASRLHKELTLVAKAA